MKSFLITVVLGTRPEAIKLAPVICEFKKNTNIDIRVILTGQHRDLVKNILDIFDLRFDKDLDLMKHGQSLNYVTSFILNGLEDEFQEYKPSLVLLQGDTTTAFATSLAAFYRKIPFAHVEAGLRTNDIFSPYPEEANRRLISQLANIHFTPTDYAKRNLIEQGIVNNVFTTGNTVVDSLISVSKIVNKPILPEIDWRKNKVILSTIHRRENLGSNLLNICNGFKKILSQHPDIIILIPMHPNKKVREPLISNLGSEPRVILIEPLDYVNMVNVLKECFLVLTDSGGLQEEAPAFSKPVLVLRDSTERQEGIEAGTSRLVGTDAENIFNNVSMLISNSEIYKSMSSAKSPFGDGNASSKIVKYCIDYLSLIDNKY